MINEETLNKYYCNLSNQLNELIPVKWEKIIMYGEELGGSISTSFNFYTDEGKEIHYSRSIPEDFSVSKEVFHMLLRELHIIIKELWNEVKRSNGKTWDTITFVLEKNWSFKVEYEYEVEADREISNFAR